MDYDAIVVGGGPGGYVCAIRLGRLGKKVLLVERNEVGGVCLQAGCIPSKALIHVAGLYRRVQEARRMGLHAEGLTLRWEETQKWKQSVVDRLTRGIHHLLKGNGVDYVQGEAEPVDAHTLRVRTTTEVREWTTEHLVLATGSEPIEIPGFPFDGETILNSTQALALAQIPESLAVIGGGYIGLELGMVYASLGCRVTVVEMMDQVLPGTSGDLVKVLERRLKRLNIRVYTGATAKDLERNEDHLELVATQGDEVHKIPCRAVLVTVGRRPTAQAGGWERIGVEYDDRGFIRTDEQRRTRIPHIFALGDVAGPPMLAHKASYEGEVVAEVIAGRPAACDAAAVPAVIFTDPEIAVVGLTERQAREQGREVRIGRFPFAALGKAQAMNRTDGFVKILADPESGIVLGAEIVGPDASSLVAELALAVELGAEARDLALTVHTHPTLPEAVMEAAKAVYGEAVHVLND